MSGTHHHGWAGPYQSGDRKPIELVSKDALDKALEEAQRLREHNQQLQRKNDRLERKNERLQKKKEQLQREIDRLQKELEAARRGVKRQTAPFSKNKKKPNPKRNGRKPGAGYGKHGSRAIPKSVDEKYTAPLPDRCACGGAAIKDEVKPQYQEEIVRKKIVRQFDVEVGHCGCCGKRLQGRHPLQTSDALDAAQVQLGPEALTLALHLNKQMGISYGNAAAVLRMGYGLEVSRGGLCRAIARMGKKTEPTYQALVKAVPQESVVGIDETGWKVEAVLRWMWVAVTDEITVYAILPGRGFAQACQLIPADFAGVLVHDGYCIYSHFEQALHQSCLGHLVRRCRDLVEIVSAAAAATFPLAVLEELEKALAVRDRYQAGEISLHGQLTAAGRIEAEIDRLLLDGNHELEADRRLAKHLAHEFPHLFTFLHCPGVEATNNRTEREVRPAVRVRHLCGGSRTWNGARTHQSLTSVLRTSQKQGKNSFDLIVGLFRNPQCVILDLLPRPLSPPTIPKLLPSP